MSAEHPLARLIDDVALLENYWNKRYGLFKQGSPTVGLVDEDAIQAQLDAGLMRWPYFTILKEGNQPPVLDFTKIRTVLGRPVNGFADPEKIRKYLAGGATMKLSQMEDWHRPIQTLMRQIESRLPAELKAYAFYTPRDNTGMLPHRDGSHVLAVQIAGSKEWRIYDSPDQIDARPGLDVDPNSRSHTFVMEPGDVLYLPHGFPHVATARGGTSLHITFTITEPTPRDLVDALMTTFAVAPDHPLERPYRIRLEDKAQALNKALIHHVESVDARLLIETAVGRMRRRTV